MSPLGFWPVFSAARRLRFLFAAGATYPFDGKEAREEVHAEVYDLAGADSNGVWAVGANGVTLWFARPPTSIQH